MKLILALSAFVIVALVTAISTWRSKTSEDFVTRTSQSPSANSRRPRLRRRVLYSIAAILALSVTVSACSTEQLKAWFDATGVDYSHTSQSDLDAQAAFATAWWVSAETSTTTTTAAPVPKRPSLPAFLVCVRNRESRGDYTAYNASSGAAGAFQFLRSTWDNTARHAGRNDLVGVNVRWVTPADQDAMAIHLYQWMGTSPWAGGQWAC